jgi:hypothetical protein
VVSLISVVDCCRWIQGGINKSQYFISHVIIV